MTNETDRERRLSVTAYLEWVLGALRPATAMHVVTSIDPRSGALVARNPYNAEFADWRAFLDVDEPARSATGDRAEFLGRNGTMADPAAMHRVALSGKVGAGLDPCAALQTIVELRAGERIDAGGGASGRCSRAICSANVPRRVDRTARAAAKSPSRCCGVMRSDRRMNTLPCGAGPS